MAIKFKGSEKSIQKYKELLDIQEADLKSNSKFINYKEKADGFRVLKGELKIKTSHGQQSERGANGSTAINPEDKLYIDGMANAHVEDRMCEIVNPQGCCVRNYVKNPILLSDHYYHSSYAIGLVEELRIEADGVHFTAYIGDPSLGLLTEKQKEIRSLVAQKILKTVSIGFIPKEIVIPEWDDDNCKFVEPIKIEKWEMLELSIVPIPCNQDSVFDIKTLTNYKHFNENETKSESTTTQTLILDKELFTVKTAKKWAEDHNFKSNDVEETDESIRLRQLDPNEFLEETFRTIELTDGVKAVIGRLKGEDAMEEKTAQELVAGIKSMSTLLQTLNATSQRSVELTEGLLKKFEEKEMPETSETTEEEKAVSEELPEETQQDGCKPKKPKKDGEESGEEKAGCVDDEEEEEEKNEKRFKELDAKIEKLAGLVKIIAERVSE